MVINLDKNQISNLLIFLDRVPVKGLNEIQAMNDICVILHNAEKNFELKGDVK